MSLNSAISCIRTYDSYTVMACNGYRSRMWSAKVVSTTFKYEMAQHIDSEIRCWCLAIVAILNELTLTCPWAELPSRTEGGQTWLMIDGQAQQRSYWFLSLGDLPPKELSIGSFCHCTYSRAIASMRKWRSLFWTENLNKKRWPRLLFFIRNWSTEARGLLRLFPYLILPLHYPCMTSHLTSNWPSCWQWIAVHAPKSTSVDTAGHAVAEIALEICLCFHQKRAGCSKSRHQTASGIKWMHIMAKTWTWTWHFRIPDAWL